jgi:hypothetical protein
MKQTAFWRGKNGECAACLKYSARISVEWIYKMQRLEVSGAVRPRGVVRRPSSPYNRPRRPWGGVMYSSTLSLTSALDGVGGQHNAPATLPPGKTRYPLYRRGWATGPVWPGAENLDTTGFRSPDRPARSKSPYRLSNPGPYTCRPVHIMRLLQIRK